EIAHAEEGVKLAERVSAEVGPRFAIACDSVEGRNETVLLRAERPAENPAAEAAFTRLREELIAEEKRTAEIFAESGGVWTAYAPLSGETFTPNQRSGRSQDQGLDRSITPGRVKWCPRSDLNRRPRNYENLPKAAPTLGSRPNSATTLQVLQANRSRRQRL